MSKRIISGLVVLMILFILGKALEYFLYPLIVRYVPYEESIEISYQTKLIYTGQLVIKYLFNIGVGIFLILEAKRNEFHCGLWFCLGVIFGFSSLILFYVLTLLKKKNNEQKDNSDILD